MKRGSKEFYELMQAFERDVQAGAIIAGRLDRDKDGIKGWYYEHGDTNAAFVAYMNGYQHAKCLARIDALEVGE